MARPDSRVCQEEVFGPFVALTTFKDEAEALAIANGTAYGLGSGLCTRDLQRTHRVAGALHAGMVWVNCYKRVHPGSPFGGVGQSGYGQPFLGSPPRAEGSARGRCQAPNTAGPELV